MTSTSGPVAGSEEGISGQVRGGLQPVSGASIQLWAAGNGGNGTGASSLLHTPVVTDGSGSFSITGDYTCPSAATQVYLTSVGGNPGLVNGSTNPALVLVAALGSCGGLSGSTNVAINEITTAAAAWALAPFFGTGSTPYNTLAASSTNANGLRNAFLNAGLLASTATGAPAALPAGLIVEWQKMVSLANALASCSNSNGGPACSPLYAAATQSGGSAPTNVLAAALNVVRNPGTNVTAVFNAQGTQPPYASGLPAAPNDWTMSLTVEGGGVQAPYGIGVDPQGNVWTANNVSGGGSVSAFSPQGTPFGTSPFGVGSLTALNALVIDRNGSVWVANADAPSNGGLNDGGVAKFAGATSSSPGQMLGLWGDTQLSGPSTLGQDPSGGGTVLVASQYSQNAVIFNLDGSVQTDALGATSVSAPGGIVSDGAGGVWVANASANTVTHLLANGTAVTVACCYQPDSLAPDVGGNLWAANYAVGSSSVTEISTSGTVVRTVSGGGIYQPGSVVVDAGGHVWLANLRAQSGQTVSSVSEVTTGGSVVSPSKGFGLDARLVAPYQVTVDASGNLWIANAGGANAVTGMQGDVVMLFGLATPTTSPIGVVPAAP